MKKMERHAANFKQLWFTTAPGTFSPHWFASKKPGYKTWFEKLKLDFETPLMDFCIKQSWKIFFMYLHIHESGTDGIKGCTSTMACNPNCPFGKLLCK